MNKSAVVFLASAAFLLMALPLHAQTGCDNSPENPTVVLALVGGAGALFSSVRARVRARRDKSER